MDSKFKKEDYVLSFQVEGVSVLVSDIHKFAYADLEVLYIIDNGLFKQYYTKKALERALDRGLKFYSDSKAFKIYRDDLNAHIKKFKRFFEKVLKKKEIFSVTELNKLFTFTGILAVLYAKMNFEYTDKAFVYQEKNKSIKENLTLVATFKDESRTYVNIVFFEEDGYLAHVYDVLSKQFSLTPKTPANLTQEEILDLFNGIMPKEEDVIKRQEAYVSSYDEKKHYEGLEAKIFLEQFKEVTPETDEIRGQVASKGKVVGIVKIIPVDYSDFSRINAEIAKMQKGDILVAETTAPEIMTACKKAAAIITDMGGLMSHAAIISREFRIPCIVGTKFATKILKDGDEIEVDADEGVIRIK